MIEFTHTYKTYSGSIHALKNINLKIEKGEFVFLTGPSGAGKTTLFKLISGYDRPTSGKVCIANYDLNNILVQQVHQFRRRVGIVFQDFKLLKDRTVFENVALPLVIRNEKKSNIEIKTNKLLKEIGLLDKATQYPDFLSGGEQQRVAIARAIVHTPEVIIADEPTGNLDPDLSEEIMDIFEKISHFGATVFIATHDLEMVKRRRKRTVQIKSGEIVEDVACVF